MAGVVDDFRDALCQLFSHLERPLGTPAGVHGTEKLGERVCCQGLPCHCLAVRVLRELTNTQNYTSIDPDSKNFWAAPCIGSRNLFYIRKTTAVQCGVSPLRAQPASAPAPGTGAQSSPSNLAAPAPCVRQAHSQHQRPAPARQLTAPAPAPSTGTQSP